MTFVGIDIGSTAAKTVVVGKKNLKFVLPTGWSGKKTAEEIKKRLLSKGIDVNDENVKIAATGYGRKAVYYADYTATEITCHGIGAGKIFGKNCTVIDVGGQDTKVISVLNGKVTDFVMNDKCAAGTGKFVEIMANRLGVEIDELFDLAQKGGNLKISSLCTVFAETEVINYIGEGHEQQDIAFAVADSVASKVALMCRNKIYSDKIVLTGGLSEIKYFAKILGEKIGTEVFPLEHGRFAGAVGAAMVAKKKSGM